MQKKILTGILSACLLSSFVISGDAFADKPNDTKTTKSSSSISVKNLAGRQNRLATDLVTLDAKLTDKAASSTDKNVMDQASLVHKAAGEAKQAADDLAQADKLTKSTLATGKKSGT
jgi:hypothetical protein